MTLGDVDEALADGDPVGVEPLADGAVDAEAPGFALAAPVGRTVDPEVEPLVGAVVRGAVVVVRGAVVVGFGAAVVGLGLAVVGGGAGAGAAGFTVGAAPEPKRKATEDPGCGL